MNIGVVLGRKGDPLSQKTQYKKALKIDKQIFGKSHNGMATSYHNFGEAYTCLGEYEKARKKYKKALDIKLKKYGQDHPSIALTYFLKGVLNYKQKNYERALELLDESLTVYHGNFFSSINLLSANIKILLRKKSLKNFFFTEYWLLLVIYISFKSIVEYSKITHFYSQIL